MFLSCICFKLWLIIGHIFASARSTLFTLTPSLRVTPPANIRINFTSSETRMIVLYLTLKTVVYSFLWTEQLLLQRSALRVMRTRCKSYKERRSNYFSKVEGIVTCISKDPRLGVHSVRSWAASGQIKGLVPPVILSLVKDRFGRLGFGVWLQ